MTEPNTLHAGDRPKVSLLLLVFIALQKHFINGILAGSVKG